MSKISRTARIYLRSESTKKMWQNATKSKRLLHKTTRAYVQHRSSLQISAIFSIFFLLWGRGRVRDDFDYRVGFDLDSKGFR